MCLGIPGQVIAMTAEDHMATVSVEGVRRKVNVGLVQGDPGGLAVGEWVLIHVGFAMAKIDEEEAARSLDFLRELGQVFDEELAGFGGTGTG
ncbi:MAG: HypC/HybG/HupF family hydrogenase formation chaperone [Acidimicrobiales bacterium]